MNPKEEEKQPTPAVTSKGDVFGEIVTKVGTTVSKQALITTLVLLLPVLYLQIPTLLTKGYYKFVLGKPIHNRRRIQVPFPPSSSSISMKKVMKQPVEEPQEAEEKEEPENGPFVEDYYYEEEEEPIDHCPSGLVLLTGTTGSVGNKATQMLLAQDFCVRIFTDNLPQARNQWSELDDVYAARLELVEGVLGDGFSISGAFEPRESSGYTSVTHVLLADTAGVEECAAAAAQIGTVESMVVMSAAWVSKPYSLASLLYNGMYDNLPSAKHWQGEEALRTIAQQQEQECDFADGSNETSRKPLNYVILRSGRLIPDSESNSGEEAGIGFSQDDSFEFWGPDGAAIPGMSHSQLAQAAVAALQVEGKYTVEVTSGSTPASKASKMFSMLLQDDENTAFNFNQTVTMEDVELVHAQAMSDFVNVIFTLLVGTALLVFLLGAGQGLFLSMTLYMITIFLWKTFLSDRTVWDCLASEMPRKLPLLQVPGVSFGIAAQS
jgi:hypothetical protein